MHLCKRSATEPGMSACLCVCVCVCESRALSLADTQAGLAGSQ